ncbi:DUF6151 family protein [Ruegeria lacuscaerulensis]|uniref:DUF6151 family protein n=1 Tax=Ruegeria lacuscaerulensis TaxID=55218 RepID=UPI00147C0174|nr:DUF6151 family protein [Ruegeria lacuscaerulensis]
MVQSPAKDTTFACTCGALSGRISAAGVASSTHVECFCHDCRAAQLYFGQPDPAPGPVDVLQMLPEGIVFEHGAEHLALMQLSPKGMLRWYASCCNAPLATTSRTPKVPFAGFIVNRIPDPSDLGPVRTRGFVPRPGGKQAHEGLGPAAIGLVTRVLKSRLSGSWKNTPFFDAYTGETSAKPTVLTKPERAALYK